MASAPSESIDSQSIGDFKEISSSGVSTEMGEKTDDKGSDLKEKSGLDEEIPNRSEDVLTPPALREDGEEEYLTGWRLISVVISLMLAVLCVALDNTIIAAAIPRITDSFSTIDDIGWYGSAYLLTTCSFQLLYSKFYTFFSVKWVFLVALSIFEVGSVLCAAAPTSTIFIVGRAIAGLGAAGLFTGATTAVVQVAPVALRPIITGMLGALFGICSILGPLLGGAFATNATWRWCFYINLPIGALAATGVIILLHVKQSLSRLHGTTFFSRFAQFDPLGNLLFISSIICLLLAVHWGGTTYAYSSPRIIILFILFALCLIAFIAVQIWQGENATIPARVFKKRTVGFATLLALSIGGTIFVMVYYLPIWFQVITSVSPITSSVHLLPIMISQLLATIAAGILTTKVGYYMPFVVASAILMPIGAGLLTTLSVGVSQAKWIGYQIIIGFGLGFGFQQGTVACQSVLPVKDVPIGTAIVFSIQFLGGTIFLSAAQNVFSNQLRSNLLALNIPGFDAENALDVGATALRKLVPNGYLHVVLVAYNAALMKAFQIALGMSCLAVLGAAGMEWVNVKEKKKEESAVVEQAV